MHKKYGTFETEIHIGKEYITYKTLQNTKGRPLPYHICFPIFFHQKFNCTYIFSFHAFSYVMHSMNMYSYDAITSYATYVIRTFVFAVLTSLKIFYRVLTNDTGARSNAAEDDDSKFMI